MQSATLGQDRQAKKSQHAKTGGEKTSVQSFVMSNVALFSKQCFLSVHVDCVFNVRVAAALQRRVPLVGALCVTLRSLPKSSSGVRVIT